MGDLDARRVQAATNQSLFREVNERIEELAAGAPSIFAELKESRTLDLACECADTTCTEQVRLTLAEYEQIRSDSNSFVVLTGHEVPEVEDVVREQDGYVIVKKSGAGAAVAEHLDPRTRNL